MKIKISIITLVFLCGFTWMDSLLAQGTAFTYQGRLNTTNGPTSGLYDLTFALFTDASGGSQADTSNGAIHPGDMLTTSSEPGYAMKVTDSV